MFIKKIQPILKEFIQQPFAFTGGFASGILRLKITDDPLKSWLQKQGLSSYQHYDDLDKKNAGPQNISID
ncbi:MAG: hypothetical protein JXR06_06045 [Candidatus Atelocyanobacterium thalassa]|uniref:Uncharacterized protein n=1 Tax=Candidatus Atelocyanobacterium thalassa isolate SIO64986 TaxID=1527444 RepID=A0A086CHT4_9CHRO|nr:MAG: hypothetical protein ucyna2_00377 [Candidatus Atelocyanobacterium thalassa isolate SIO64986]